MNMMIIRFDRNLYDLESPGKGKIGYIASTGEEVWSHDDFIEDLSRWPGFKMEIIMTGFSDDDIEEGL